MKEEATKRLKGELRSSPRRIRPLAEKKEDCGLYLGYSRSARPLPRGFTGHVAHPGRSIAGCGEWERPYFLDVHLRCQLV